MRANSMVVTVPLAWVKPFILFYSSQSLMSPTFVIVTVSSHQHEPSSFSHCTRRSSMWLANQIACPASCAVVTVNGIWEEGICSFQEQTQIKGHSGISVLSAFWLSQRDDLRVLRYSTTKEAKSLLVRVPFPPWSTGTQLTKSPPWIAT